MTIKEIRRFSKLTQSDFAGKYHIPLSTLKQWESSPGSTSYRKCPIYVNELLLRAVKEDLEKERERKLFYTPVSCHNDEPSVVDELFGVASSIPMTLDEIRDEKISKQ